MVCFTVSVDTAWPRRDGLELIKDLGGAGYLIIRTGDGDDIAAGKKVRIQAVIEHAQVIVRTTQHAADVGGI